MDYLKELQDLSFDARHYIKTIVAGSGAFEIFLDDTLCEKLSRDDSNKIREILSGCVDNLFSYIDKIKSEKRRIEHE